MAVAYPGPTNTYLPMPSGVVVGYILDPKEFALNSYVTWVQSDTPDVYYQRLDRDEPIRNVTTADTRWAPGADRPTGHTNHMNFTWVTTRAQRRAYTVELDTDTVNLSRKYGQWDVETTESKSIASKMMVEKVNRVAALATTTGNWGTHYAAANTLNGGYGLWVDASSDPASGSWLAIEKTINRAVKQIELDTNGVVKRSDLMLIVNPTAAIAIAETSEIRETLKYGRYILPRIETGNTSGVNQDDLYGMPPRLYGLQVVVDATAYVSTRPYADGTAGTRQFCYPDNYAIICSKKDGIRTTIGSKPWSTFQMFYYGQNGGEMEVESDTDSWNRKTKVSVSSYWVEEMVSAFTGYLITNILS